MGIEEEEHTEQGSWWFIEGHVGGHPVSSVPLEAGNPHEMLRMTGEGEGKQPIGRWSLKPWVGEG